MKRIKIDENYKLKRGDLLLVPNFRVYNDNDKKTDDSEKRFVFVKSINKYYYNCTSKSSKKFYETSEVYVQSIDRHDIHKDAYILHICVALEPIYYTESYYYHLDDDDEINAFAAAIEKRLIKNL